MATRVILITGPPGIGKTAVAQALAERLPGTKARLCGDVFLLAVAPFQASDERRLFLRENLTSFTRHAVEHGYDWVILEFVILEDAFINAFVDSLGAESKAEYRNIPAGDTQACHDWMKQIQALKVPRPIDTSALSVEQTVEQVRDLIERLATGSR